MFYRVVAGFIISALWHVWNVRDLTAYNIKLAWFFVNQKRLILMF